MPAAEAAVAPLVAPRIPLGLLRGPPVTGAGDAAAAAATTTDAGGTGAREAPTARSASPACAVDARGPPTTEGDGPVGAREPRGGVPDATVAQRSCLACSSTCGTARAKR